MGVKDNTYKFASANFLLDYCRSPGAKANVRYTEIAEHFFDHYWAQECKSLLLQGPPNPTPLVIQIIREKFSKRYYPQSLKKSERRNRKQFKNVL